jgi:hypothetical protein
MKIKKCPPLFPRLVFGEYEENKKRMEENKKQWEIYLNERSK